MPSALLHHKPEKQKSTTRGQISATDLDRAFAQLGQLKPLKTTAIAKAKNLIQSRGRRGISAVAIARILGIKTSRVQEAFGLTGSPRLRHNRGFLCQNFPGESITTFPPRPTPIRKKPSPIKKTRKHKTQRPKKRPANK